MGQCECSFHAFVAGHHPSIVMCCCQSCGRGAKITSLICRNSTNSIDPCGTQMQSSCMHCQGWLCGLCLCPLCVIGSWAPRSAWRKSLVCSKITAVSSHSVIGMHPKLFRLWFMYESQCAFRKESEANPLMLGPSEDDARNICGLRRLGAVMSLVPSHSVLFRECGPWCHSKDSNLYIPWITAAEINDSCQRGPTGVWKSALLPPRHWCAGSSLDQLRDWGKCWEAKVLTLAIYMYMLPHWKTDL